MAKRVQFNLDEVAMVRASLSSREAVETMAIQPYTEVVKKYLTQVMSRQPVQSLPPTQAVKIEIRSIREQQLVNVTINRNNREKVLIEQFINTVRVSLKLQHVNAVQDLISKSFISSKAECSSGHFVVLRHNPVEGYDVTFVLTNLESEHLKVLATFVENFLLKMEEKIDEIRLAALSK